MIDIDRLGERAAAWHCARFPAATLERVALKLASETGEVCDAVIAYTSRNEHPERADQVGPEAADVMIVLLILLARWFPDVDLRAEVERKLAKLEARL